MYAERLHVGDQILVVDGISLTEVTHADAVAALEKAMNMESVSNHIRQFYGILPIEFL